MKRLLAFLKTLDAHDHVGIFSAGIVVSLVIALIFGALQQSDESSQDRMVKDGGGKTQYAESIRNVRLN